MRMDHVFLYRLHNTYFSGLVPVSTGRRKMEKLSVDCDHVKTRTLNLNANNNKLVAQAA